MKTLTALMTLVISLSLAGCAAQQSGNGSVGATTKSGKMLTKKDYDRMGVKETEDLRK